MKYFVKALDENGAAFQHLSTVFPGLNAAKLKKCMGSIQISLRGFLGNTHVPDYQVYI